ncbi:uncharacterized protein EDB91DRAFT_1088288 [Suillus paluster]|uniref:uncharacterized protein n=1 Tax=Suillus paluster TaxID=48578 RepID=UPI001B874D05|nr:uncharacterized protein EDB91DRAFT_1088288 [Suillus paluster]KAG1721989.1 hypothetical protein EDB91DRAFT_1088288 [Suillus paluster]
MAASSAPLHIFSIVTRIDDASKKKVEFVELELGSQRQEVLRGSGKDKELSAKFDHAIHSVGTVYHSAVTTEQASLWVHCQHHSMGVLPWKSIVKFPLDRQDILSDIVDQDVHEMTRKKMKMTVVITISDSVHTRQLQPTSSDILEICPRFRLLVIGKTGVGKSSLIHQAFKIDEVVKLTKLHVSGHSRGVADINREFVAPQNRRFVLHDSEGFEAGDTGSFAAAKEFIGCRRNMPALKDKIHAVWLCLSIPHSDGRLLESGVKEFLELRKEILGNIPVIVVFTKHDVLLDTLELEAIDLEDCYGTALENLKRDKLNNLCIKPLTDAAGSDVLHAAVSTKNGYENTVRELIDLTTTNVEKFVASEAALAMMIAQRVDISLKIKASIAIGEKRYWRGLASSMDFAGFTMKDCLSVIHKDVIDVWNFNDPHDHLASSKFQELILNDLDKEEFPNTAGSFKFGLSVVGAIIGIMTPLAAPFLPIVAPIAAGVVMAKWVYDIYQQTNITLRRMMAYIVDLTCIMQIAFLLAPTGPISRRVIKIAIKAYDEAGKSSVHSAIHSHVPLTRSGGDDALEEIVKLIQRHSIKAEEVQDLRTKIGPHMVGLQLDEEW